MPRYFRMPRYPQDTVVSPRYRIPRMPSVSQDANSRFRTVVAATSTLTSHDYRIAEASVEHVWHARGRAHTQNRQNVQAGFRREVAAADMAGAMRREAIVQAQARA